MKHQHSYKRLHLLPVQTTVKSGKHLFFSVKKGKCGKTMLLTLFHKKNIRRSENTQDVSHKCAKNSDCNMRALSSTKLDLLKKSSLVFCFKPFLGPKIKNLLQKLSVRSFRRYPALHHMLQLLHTTHGQSTVPYLSSKALVPKPWS